MQKVECAHAQLAAATILACIAGKTLAGGSSLWKTICRSGTANKAEQPTGAARLVHRQIERPRRAAPVADPSVQHEESINASTGVYRRAFRVCLSMLWFPACRRHAHRTARLVCASGRYLSSLLWSRIYGGRRAPRRTASCPCDLLCDHLVSIPVGVKMRQEAAMNSPHPFLSVQSEKSAVKILLLPHCPAVQPAFPRQFAQFASVQPSRWDSGCSTSIPGVGNAGLVSRRPFWTDATKRRLTASPLAPAQNAYPASNFPEEPGLPSEQPLKHR